MHRFHYRNNGHWLDCAYTTIELDNDLWPPKRSNESHRIGSLKHYVAALRAVRWSPPFQAPISPHGVYANYRKDISRLLENWIIGARKLKNEFERKEAVFETKMQEGTCVIFDNWRILHARRAFSGGERWLRGAYIDNPTLKQHILRHYSPDICDF